MGKLKTKKVRFSEADNTTAIIRSNSTTSIRRINVKSSINLGSDKAESNIAPFQQAKVDKDDDEFEFDDDLNDNKNKKIKKLNSKLTKRISNVQFKASKKLKNENNKSTFTKLKTNINKTNKSKYEAIKTNFLDQIKKAAPANLIDKDPNEASRNDFNFKRVEVPSRLTNSLIKTLLSSKDKSKEGVKADGILSSVDPLRGVKQLNKKTKAKLKKQIWQEKINLIKTQIKDSEEKAKREKTVIVGDMKPIIESLFETTTIPANKNQEKSNTSSILTLPLSKRDKREKNLESQNSKVIQKQSIRNKKSKEDMSLFNQLMGYTEFTNNPLETLKKHFTS